MSVADAPTAGIQLTSLTKTFGHHRAVDDVTFTVEPGAVTGFLGPNGAGKTTTLRMLLGLVTPSSGTAQISGRAYRELDLPGRHVGALLDATGFHPGRTGRDHLCVYAPAAGVGERRVDEVLDQVGLADSGRQRVRGYSLGMRQRLGLAAALLPDPEVIICDEPTNGLDPDGIRWLRGLLRDLAARGRTVLVSSHQLAEMQQTVDSVVIVNHGRLIFSGDVGSIGGQVRVRSLDNATLHAAITAESAGSAIVEIEGDEGLLVRGVSADQIGQAALRVGVALRELHTEQHDLEQLFFTLTSDEQSADAAGTPTASTASETR